MRLSFLLAAAAVIAGGFAIGFATRATAPTPEAPAAGHQKLSLQARMDGRAEQERAIYQDENGQIPHDAIMRAKEQLALLPAGIGAGLDSDAWTDLGPGNIGGRIRSILIHPTTPSTIFVGSVSGGIWKTTNAGTSWSRVDDRMGNLSVTTMAFQPGNPNTMYAGTGEQSGGGLRGAGIWRSTDGGATWSRLASTNTPAFYFVWRLAISPDGNTLLVGTGSSSGLQRSTDGGATWTGPLQGPNSRVWDVRFHPTNSNIAVASFGDYDFSAASWFSTCYYSTDSGATWTESTGIRHNDSQPRRSELAWHAGYSGAGNGAVYAMKDIGNTTVFRSLDGGATWAQVAAGSGILGTQGGYDNTLWVDPSDTDANPANDVIVAGGVNQYRSSDGGATFTVIGDWRDYPTGIHADHHLIVAHPGFNGTTNKTVYFGCDGGIWRTDDIYATARNTGWVQLNNSLAITQFYGASRHAGTDTVFGGTQDQGNLQTTPAKGFNGWTVSIGGDGGFTASDPTDNNYHYGEYVYGQMSRSTNGGNSSHFIYGAGKGAPYEITEASLSQGNFIAPFIMDPNNPERLLLGLRSLWRTDDARAPLTATTGPSWATIKAPVGTDSISAVTVAVGNADVIWVGHNSGAVFSTADGTSATPTWTQRDAQIPDRYITRIVLHPTEANTVFVTLGGFTADNIWKSTDGGANWTAIATPQMPVRDLEISPARTSWYYAATEVGLLTSEDAGATWSSSASYSDVPVHETFFSGDRLYLATHGRGIFWGRPAIAKVDVKGVACRTGDGAMTGPTLAATAPILGQIETYTLSDLGANSSAALFMGTEANPPVPFLGCSLYIEVSSLQSLGMFQISGTTGTRSFRVPRLASLIGNPLALQAGVVAGTEMTIFLSNAVIVTPGY